MTAGGEREDRSRGLDMVLLGLPKTGTTWLASVLAQAGSLELFDESEKIEQLWARPDRRSVLIAESATDPLFARGLEARPPALRAFTARLRARHHVLVLREPHDWICSLYRQYLRRGGSAGFRDFVGDGDAHVVQPRHADYGRLVDEVERHIDGPLAVCSYDRLAADPRGFVDDLVHALGGDALPADLADRIPDASLEKRANVGVRGLGARVIRRVNRTRRTRWNPGGRFSWKRFERLPWHLLAGGRDVIEAGDRRWLENLLAGHADWHLWQAEFATRGVVLREAGADTDPA